MNWFVYVLLLGGFICCVRLNTIDILVYPRIVPGCEGDDALLYVPLGLIEMWYALDICRLFQIMAVHLVLTPISIAWLIELD